jgi:hypothetical protein
MENMEGGRLNPKYPPGPYVALIIGGLGMVSAFFGPGAQSGTSLAAGFGFTFLGMMAIFRERDDELDAEDCRC